ncbi:unnamed protein product [Rotaria sordida]|uniref:Uncharacterized protein n=1 Tax=Rotaria sordida TaxID=392033 RepID=A0A813R2R7_9BILA|nr:unnamed protein product [Rotaria sordida]CAF0786428.1 unnamed protein product [Rotaria sordida]
MLGLPPDHPQLNTADREEIVKFFANEVAKYDANWLDTTANEVYRQAGTICYTPEEFAQTEQGKAIKLQGLWITEAVNTEKLPVVPWPALKDQNLRPLAGVKIVDISRVIAAPTITRILASLGATVIRVSNSIEPDYGIILLETNLGKYDMRINLKTPEGKKELAHILAEADVILDGYRPGCMERLGFGRQAVHEMALNRGKGIVYARENCYGWAGPWSPRSGWQQISDCVTGVSWLQGKFLGLDEPVVPLLPNSDYQTGVIGAIAIVQALHKRAHQGGSYNVDVSLNQFNIWYLDLGQYTDTQRADIMVKYPDLHLHHTDEMHFLVKKTITVMLKSVGKIFGSQNFETINSPKWDVEHTGEPITMTILAPIITFDETKLNYNVGSCPPGSYDSSIGWNVV